MYIALLMVIPIIVGVIGLALSKKRPDANLSLKEFAVMELACLAIFGIGYGIARFSVVYDTELISGRVTGKEQNTVSCSHSYSCNCRETCSGTGKDRSCSTTCDTCYDHSHDYDWDVYTNAMKNTVTIDRVDRQGVDTPPRWAAIQVGEPVVFQHMFSNYVKADPGSVLLRRNVKAPKGLELPQYPNKTWDYYKTNRFLQVGRADPNAARYNDLLMSANGDLGPSKQANVIIMEVNSADPSYEYYVEQEWLRGKKNDVIVILGITQHPKIDWVAIVSWTTSAELKVELRDALMELGRVDDPDKLVGIIKEQVTQKFQRRHFKDFEYMMASVQPGPVATIILMILGLLTCGGLTIYFYRNDPFGDEWQSAQARMNYRRY